MKILIEIKTVYGVERIYPVCDQAKIFATIANKKTLDRRDLKLIQDLGFTINRFIGDEFGIATVAQMK